MIVNDKGLRKKRLAELSKDLLSCSYPSKLVQDAIDFYQDADSKELRIPKQKQPEDIMTFVTTYNPRNTRIFPVVKNSLPMMNRSETMKKILSRKKIIHSQRQPKNLKRLLTTSSLQVPTDDQQVPKVTKCQNKKCQTCDLIIEGDSYYFKHSQLKFKVQHNMTCTSSSVIYCMECSNCGEYYIGQTGGPLQKRMTLHRSHINHPRYRILNVSEHIATCAVGKKPPFKVFPFYQCFDMSTTEREIKEQYFINKLKPKLNSTQQ